MKKVIITIIILIVSICGIIGFWIINNQIKEETLISDLPESQNENATDENLINEEFVITLEDEENKTSTDEEDPSLESKQDNSENDKKVIPEKSEAKKTVSKSTTSNSASSGKSNTSSSQNTNTKTSTTASKQTTTSSNSNNSKSNKSTSTSSNNKTPTTPSTETKKTPVYCYEGGKKHLGGDGKYEHGYYNTWEQAWNALTVYMKNMTSGNYYIEQCMGCNKYYYYCKQD